MKTLLRFVAAMSLMMAAVLGWSTAAMAQMDADTQAYANAIVCTDPECADSTNARGMEGALVSSLDASGAVIDTCSVETFPSGLDGCTITKHAGDGSYTVAPTDEYAHYTLLSEQPEVHESVSHGTQLVWYFAPPADDPAPPPAETDPVDELPEVGVGVGESSQAGLMAAAVAGIALMAVGSWSVRGVRR